MNQWPYVIAAYAVTLIGTASIAGWAWIEMRRAENAVDGLRR